MYRIAKRLDNFDSAIFQEVFRKKQTLKNPVDLSFGYPEGDTPEHIKNAGICAIRDNHTIYTSANGISELRTAIAEKLVRENGIHVTADEVCTVPGLTTGFLIIYLALLNPGDEAIIMDPSFPPYISLAEAVGATVKLVSVFPNFQLDLMAIEASITPKTRLIVINTPNNPTGAVYAKKDLTQLAAIAKKHDIIIVSDEMYDSFIYAGEHFSIGSIYSNTLTLNGFSKSYAMTGWRLGYIAGPKQIINALNQLQQYAVFCSPSIAQHAAIAALKEPVASREIYFKKRQLIINSLTKVGYDIQGNDGAFYTYFKVPSGSNDMEFIDLAMKENLILLPGRIFSQEQTFVRLSYGGNIKEIEKGLNIITKITERL
jgi:aspartate aminotransferase/aminotransferase